MIVVPILNSSFSSPKLSTEFSYNFAQTLVNNDKRVLYLSTTLTPFEFLRKNTKSRSIKQKNNTVSPFEFRKIKSNFYVMFLTNSKQKNIKIKNVKIFLNLLNKQIDLIETKYDYMVVDCQLMWKELDALFISSATGSRVHYCNVKTFNQEEFVQNIILAKKLMPKSAPKSVVILDDFKPQENESISTYTRLSKFPNEFTFWTLPSKEDPNNFDYVLKEPWSSKTINLSELSLLIIN